MNTKIPDLNDILAPLLIKYGLGYDSSYDKISGRPVKHGAKMKSWNTVVEDIEVFVYDDNTIALRANCEIEHDLSATDPRFCDKLEAWLKSKGLHAQG